MKRLISLLRCSAWVAALGLSSVSLLLAQEELVETDDATTRNANYRIEVTLDPESKVLTGRETITWTNVQEQPTDELWFHLYWNAWRNNRSTWLLESRLRGRLPDDLRIEEGDWGYVEVNSIKLLPGMGYSGNDLTGVMRYASPDDGNPEDRTVLVVPLPTPVGPDEAIQIEVAWRSKIPRTFRRTGFRGDFFFLAHWFPKLGVFEEEGWNNHQFHAATEFFSDYGVYDVSMTVPKAYVLGATGKEVDLEVNPDETVTHRYRQEDVHDFTWTTSPKYQVRESRFEEPGLPSVDMRLLLQPEHLEQAERHFEATAAALLNYGKWFGPYPYDHITVVDPAFGSGAGGMEYPTLFTCGTRLFNPFGGGSPEGVTVHEAGHQFWYGLVGNNEFEFAWLDEGFNTFSTARTMEVTFGDSLLVQRYLRPPGMRIRGGFLPVLFRDIKRTRVGGSRLDGYRSVATADFQSTPTFKYFPSSSSAMSYNKTALWLLTLERYLGWDTLQEIMSTFFARFRFRHPRPQDFFDVANEVTESDLAWFFDQVHGGSETFDYAVQSVASDPISVKGFLEKEGKLIYSEPDGEGKLYRTEVVVRRNGSAIFPVEVLMVFDDGTEVRKEWDGASRWELYVEERPAQLKYAVVDPERKLVLDLYYTNNSQLLKPASKFPSRKWASKWMIWFQDALATFAFFV